MQTGPWVLIVDDDTAFSSLLTDLLTSAGYSTYSAISCDDATEVISRETPALAIVDYQLSENNGINWIMSARESGYKFPVILLSGVWHDERSFHRLRNILQISLFLRKPIDVDLFLAEISHLLPPIAAAAPSDFNEIEKQMESSDAKWSPYNRAQMQHPEKLELALKKARIAFAQQLPSRASQLIQTIQALKIDPERSELRATAYDESHRLAGSAGSFGFHSVGQVAEKICGLLHNLELDASTMSDLVWSELIRALTSLQTQTNQAWSETGADSANTINTDGRKIALLSDRIAFEKIKEFSTDVDVLWAQDPGSIVGFAKEKSLQSLFIDLSVCPMSSALEVVRVFRLTSGYEGLEIRAIVDKAHSFSASELLYLGASKLVNKPISDASRELFGVMTSAAPKVLLVDDDPAITDFIGALLSARGMTVDLLNDPIQILNRVERFRPDLILLDILMPGLSGYDLCRLLRSSEEWSAIPIMFLTSKTDSESRRLAFKAGGSDFLAKPIVSEELMARVNLHLPKREDLQNHGGFVSRAELERLMNETFIDATSKEQPVTFALIQMDNIEAVRDAFGIAITDFALSQIGRTIQVRFRSSEIKGQLADLFVIVFPNTEAAIVESALELLAQEVVHLQIGVGNLQIFEPSISFGTAQLRLDTVQGADLLAIALGRLRRAQQKTVFNDRVS